jgi:hypothetical protein
LAQKEGGMSREDEQCLKLGREVARLIRELYASTSGERGYSIRRFTFPGGEVHMILCNQSELADTMDAAASAKYEIAKVSPLSEPHS